MLTALTAAGRTVSRSATATWRTSTGWVWYFLICAAAAIPSFVLLAYLQRRGHFATLAEKPVA